MKLCINYRSIIGSCTELITEMRQESIINTGCQNNGLFPRLAVWSQSCSICKLDRVHTPVKIIFLTQMLWVLSAVDKLLGQLGIYATRLSSMAYLQKQLRIFIFYLRHVFFCDYTYSYCMKPSGMGLHINSLPSFAFLKYQTSVFNST